MELSLYTLSHVVVSYNKILLSHTLIRNLCLLKNTLTNSPGVDSLL